MAVITNIPPKVHPLASPDEMLRLWQDRVERLYGIGSPDPYLSAALPHVDLIVPLNDLKHLVANPAFVHRGSFDPNSHQRIQEVGSIYGFTVRAWEAR